MCGTCTSGMIPSGIPCNLDKSVIMVNSGVKIHGKPRSCLVGDARKKQSKRTRSGFRMDSKTVGKIMSFVSATLVAGTTSHPIELAFVQLWDLCRDSTMQLEYVTTILETDIYPGIVDRKGCHCVCTWIAE